MHTLTSALLGTAHGERGVCNMDLQKLVVRRVSDHTESREEFTFLISRMLKVLNNASDVLQFVCRMLHKQPRMQLP